jgi:hypothetical protein
MGQVRQVNVVLLSFFVAVLAGCLHLSPVDYCYVSVRLQNDANIDVAWVSIGPEGPNAHKSEFGVLGNRGAGATALVPLCFIKDFPITWEEGDDEAGKGRQTKVDLSGFKGCSSITLSYQGNGVWTAKRGDQPARSTNTVSNVMTNK